MVRSGEPLIIGHRGAPGYRPEHTRGSYELALAQGADAVEPDLVPTRDGVLVVRHENEISGTTDIAAHPEFEHRRTTKVIEGRALTGWFTEDFTWAELSTLRATERLPHLRPASAAFDGVFPLLRFTDLLSLVAGWSTARPAPALVVELKHPTYFASVGLPLDELVERDIAAQWPALPSRDRLVVESFEKSVLGRLQRRGFRARYVYLLAAEGSAFDLQEAAGGAAPTYAEEVEGDHLLALRGPGPSWDQGAVAVRLDGISVDKAVILEPSAPGHENLVARAHEVGLEVYCWTLRPENAFLAPPFRTGREGSFGDWPAELDALRSSGVDGIFTDHPDLVAR